MHKSSSNVDLVKEFYLQFKNQNKQSYMDPIDDNVEWITMEHLPNGGKYIGKSDVFERYFPAMLSNFKEFHAIADEYLGVGNDSVLVLGSYTVKPKKIPMISKYRLLTYTR